MIERNQVPGIHQSVTDCVTDHQAIAFGRDGNNRTKIGRLLIGKGAHFWIKNSPIDEKRTDRQYAELLGICRSQVTEARNVYRAFCKEGDVTDVYPKCSWEHLRYAYSWENGEEILDWADKNSATLQEMLAWKQVADRFPKSYRDEVRLDDRFFQVALNWDRAEAWLEWARDSSSSLEYLIQYRDEVYRQHREELIKNAPDEDQEDSVSGAGSLENLAVSDDVKKFLSSDAKKKPADLIKELRGMSGAARRLKKDIDELAHSEVGIYFNARSADRMRKQISDAIDTFREELESSFQFVLCKECRGAGCKVCKGSGVVLEKMLDDDENEE